MSALPLSAFECGVCLALVYQPVSLSCGHTFCRVCLIKTLRINKRCPTCRAVCHISAEDQPEDVMIAEIVRMCFPELAERRRREAEEERNLTEVLPIFYYHMPMFPGETISLRLYEPRYKLMMQRIMNTSRRFAYVPNRTNYSANIGDVALVAEVRDFDVLSDGQVLLVAKLTSRVTVICHFIEEGTQGPHYCRVKSRIDETPPAGSTIAAETAELVERTRNLIDDAIEPIRSHLVNIYGDIPRSAESLSLWIAAFLPFSPLEKHALLAGTSTLARLLACEPHLVSLGGSAPREPFPRSPSAAVAGAHEHRLDAIRTLGDVSTLTPSTEEGRRRGRDQHESRAEDATTPRVGARDPADRAEGEVLVSDGERGFL